MTSVGWRKAKDKESIDYDKLDRFIDLALSKYTYHEADKSLYDISGEQAYFIINNNSLVPDLVIFNKTFNKNLCFHDFKGSSFNPFPRRKFKFEAKNPLSQENDEKRDNASNDSNDEIQWANTDVNEMTKTFTFTKLPQKIEKETETEKDDIDELLNFKQDDISEVIHEETIKDIVEDEEKPTLENNDFFNMNIFLSDNKNNSQVEGNEMNDFDINLLTQMAQNVYGMTNDDSQDNQSISKDDESFKEATGIKSILNDDYDLYEKNEKKKDTDTAKDISIDDKKKYSFTSNTIINTITPSNTNNNDDKIINKNINIHASKPFVPNANPSTNISSQNKPQNQGNTSNTIPSSQAQTQNPQQVPLFPPQYLNYITNYYNQLQGVNPNNQKNPITTKDKKQDNNRLSIDIDDPINIVYKNTMGRWWFIKSENKLINANSYELLEFMEAYQKTGKDLFDLTITDYQTDMYFSPITLLENLREVIPQIKSAMLLQMQLGKVNSNQATNQKSSNQNGNKKKEVKK